MQLQLSSVFYTFYMGTRAHFFGRTILHCGAKYRATGRGFVVQHKSFAENYRLYARSHFIKAIELGLILTVYAYHSTVSKDTFVYLSNLRPPFLLTSLVLQLEVPALLFSFCPGFIFWLLHSFLVGIAYARDKYAARDHIYYRLVRFLLITLAILAIVALLEFKSFKFVDLFTIAQKKAFFEAHYKNMAARKAAALLEQANAMLLRWKMKLRLELERKSESRKVEEEVDMDFISNNPDSAPRTIEIIRCRFVPLVLPPVVALAPPLPAVHHPPPSSVLVGDANRGFPSDEVTYSRSSQCTRTTTGTSSDRPRHLRVDALELIFLQNRWGLGFQCGPSVSANLH
ncbi:hypothetical protein Tsubulata_026533 [Turnera subulata]|uniref:Glycosyl transferase 48 domain-containing protein n=1 Tax=Turnera subulata TaxID=218843 RepID=A0A9Q0FFL2_9ROSI|nr:hypothetical protein Tsubulata_026533 [Turnera subulata]